MEQITARIRKWGNSFGILLPKNVLARQQLEEGNEITFTVQSKRSMTVSQLMQQAQERPLHRPNQSTAKILRAMDRELYGKASRS